MNKHYSATNSNTDVLNDAGCFCKNERGTGNGRKETKLKQVCDEWALISQSVNEKMSERVSESIWAIDAYQSITIVKPHCQAEFV